MLSPMPMKATFDEPEIVTLFFDGQPLRNKIAKIEGTTLVPLSQIEQRFTELDPNQHLYIHCKMGGRSMKAVEFLKQQGEERQQHERVASVLLSHGALPHDQVRRRGLLS